MNKKINYLKISCNFFLSDPEKDIKSVTSYVDKNLMEQVAQDDRSALDFLRMACHQQVREASEAFEDLTTTSPTDILGGDYPELTIDKIEVMINADIEGIKDPIEGGIVVEKAEKDSEGNVIRIMSPHEMLSLATLNCMSLAAMSELAIKEVIEKINEEQINKAKQAPSDEK